MHLKYLFTTFLALLAFAGNSVLCRLALGDASIDATSFTLLRLASGALFLSVLLVVLSRYKLQKIDWHNGISKVRLTQACMLFIYAAGFSYAYIALGTAVGALVLFGIVQLSMISFSIFKRQRLQLLQWCGLLLAFTGLVYLVGSQTDLRTASISAFGFVSMAIAGMAWAAYTILGKGSVTPLADTTFNFVLSVPLSGLLLVVYWFMPAHLSTEGMVLALASGVITSGVGYAIWYYALEGLSAIQAGVVQLLVPVIAALGGVVWVGEGMTTALFVSQFVILGGIALVIFKTAK